ncbi:MAG: hypothetical protein QOG45_522 [Chloroflexota bacterium]|jgi:hypothetical protein|nr:hypothetical protein [Chloroflexota bacterium]
MAMADQPRLDDHVLDNMSVDPLPSGRRLRTVGNITSLESANVVASTLESFSWSSLMDLAEGIRDRHGIGKDGLGLRYPGDDLDPWDEPYHDVLVYDQFDRVLVGVDAFERLATRYFRALVTGAQRLDDPVTRQPWWPGFVAATEEIERRVASQGDPPH